MRHGLSTSIVLRRRSQKRRGEAGRTAPPQAYQPWSLGSAAPASTTAPQRPVLPHWDSPNESWLISPTVALPSNLVLGFSLRGRQQLKGTGLRAAATTAPCWACRPMVVHGRGSRANFDPRTTAARSVDFGSRSAAHRPGAARRLPVIVRRANSLGSHFVFHHTCCSTERIAAPNDTNSNNSGDYSANNAGFIGFRRPFILKVDATCCSYMPRRSQTVVERSTSTEHKTPRPAFRRVVFT